MKRRTFQSLALAAGATAFSSLYAQNSRKPIKIGQIGTTHAHAGGQLASMRQCPDFEVVGVVEPDAKRRQAAEKQSDYAGVTWMTQEQLLNTPGLEAVSVESNVGDLLTYAEQVINAGLHLHLDKPAGESLPHFKRILEKAETKKLIVKMGYMFRYNPAFQLMIKAVREGWLGDVFSIHAEMSKLLSPAEREPMLKYAGGSMFELGCHLIDSIVRVAGKPTNVVPYIRRSRDDKFADNMLAVLEYPNATVTARSAFIEVDGGVRRQFVVCGTKGTVEIRPLEPPGMKLILDQPRGEYRKGVQEVTFPTLGRYAADWVDFAKAIRGEITWEFHAEHDLAVQETVLRASGMTLL